MSRALGLVLGVAADAVLGDPRRGHPVAAFGSWAATVERELYADSRSRGAAFTAVAVAPVLACGVAAERLTRRHPVAHTLATAVVTWACLGARSLAREGHAKEDRLATGDLGVPTITAQRRLTVTDLARLGDDLLVVAAPEALSKEED